jgi:hypothetical protein
VSLADSAGSASSIALLRTSVFGDYYVLIAAAKEISMLWTIAVLLLILWALGMVSSYTLGGFIHILLVLAIVVVLIRVIQGRSPVV